ncbi:hypothetical protein BH10PSE2_BH10PSE2_12560 [soil metagenome]
MTSQLDRFLSDTRRMGRNAQAATTTAVASGEMLKAAGDVIAARLEIMAAGLANPGKADFKEMSLMSSEKVEALSASAQTIASNFTDLSARMSKSAMDEVDHASRAASAMSTAASPAALAGAQYAYAVGWWGRMTGQMLTLNTELLKAQADALRPVHDTAVANARRLKK